MDDSIDLWNDPEEKRMEYPPSYFGGFMNGLLGDAPAANTSVLDEGSREYNRARRDGEGAAHLLNLATFAAPAVGPAVKAAAKWVAPAAGDMLMNHMVKNGMIMPVDTWHASPAKFGRLDSSKIGSGIGAQNQGYGLYLTGSEQGAQRAGAMLKGKHPEVNQYKFDLPDEMAGRMIKFDEPLSAQHPNVQRVAAEKGLLDPDYLGGDLVAATGRTKEGAAYLRDKGIPGVQYQGQGAVKGPNYVVFPGEEDAVKMLERNGQRVNLTEAEINALPKTAKARYIADQRAVMEGDSLFDMSNLQGVPDVPQSSVIRWNPKRPPDKMGRLLANKKAYNEAVQFMKNGMTEDGIGWYNMDPLRQAFIKELGPEAGGPAFDRYIDYVAATSAGAKTPTNARIASYYYQRDRQGLPAEKPAKGSGYGHKAQNLHFSSSKGISEGVPLDHIENPKRYTFAENLKGNQASATVDKHNVRAWAMFSKDPEWIGTKLVDAEGAGKPSWWNTKKYGDWDPVNLNPREFVTKNKIKWDKIPATWFEEAPTKTTYRGLEELNRRLANDVGLTPAQAQAALWLGAGERTGLGSPPVAFMKVMDSVVKDAAAKRGLSPKEALGQFIRGDRALGLAAIPTGAGASLWDSGEDY